jgi:hypothetical protein
MICNIISGIAVIRKPITNNWRSPICGAALKTDFNAIIIKGR